MIKKYIVMILQKNRYIWWMVSYFRIRRRHLEREKRIGHKYYIIGYDDPQNCGWTVWERVVLYNSMYAVEHRMVPVVDMQNYRNIYLEEGEIGRVNAWEKYYLQPGGGVTGGCVKIKRLCYC